MTKQEDQWNKRCIKLIEALGNTGKYNKIIESRELIKNIADESRKTKIFNTKYTQEKYAQLKKHICNQTKDKKRRVEIVTFHLIERIANSPFKLMADCVIRLMTPMIDEFMNEVEVQHKKRELKI